MKRIIMFVLLFAALKVAGQTTGYLRFDTVRIMKQNGFSELYLINKTKDSLGLLTNVGGGLTQFRKSKMLNDSTIIIGLDTLVIPGSGGGGSGITGLTAGRITLSTNATTVGDDAGLTYNSTQNKVTTDSIRNIKSQTDTIYSAVMPVYVADTIYFFGDSYTTGTGATSNATRWTTQLTGWLNLIEKNLGVSGSTLMKRTPIDPYGAVNMIDRKSLIPTYGPNMAWLVISYGFNDVGYNGANYTAANFRIDYQEIIDEAISKGWPLHRIIIVGPYFGGTDTYSAYNSLTGTPLIDRARHLAFIDTAQATATFNGTKFASPFVAELANDSVQLITGADNIHANNWGHAIIAQSVYTTLTDTVKANGQTLAINGKSEFQDIRLSNMDTLAFDAPVLGIGANNKIGYFNNNKIIRATSLLLPQAGNVNLIGKGLFGNVSAANGIAQEKVIVNGGVKGDFLRAGGSLPGGLAGSAVEIGMIGSAGYVGAYDRTGGSGLNLFVNPFGAVVMGGLSPSGSSVLQVTGNTSVTDKLRIGDLSTPTMKFEVISNQAMLIPVGTTGQQPAGVAGYFRYNSTDNIVEWYNGSAWVRPSTTGADGNGIYTGNGSLPSDVTVTGGANGLTFTSTRTSTNSTVNINNTSSGRGLSASSVSGIGFHGSSTNSIGILGISTNSTGVWAEATASHALYAQSPYTDGAALFVSSPATTNTTHTILNLTRASTSAGANNIAGSVDFNINNSTGAGSVTKANQLISQLTTATASSEVSRFTIMGVNAGAPTTVATFDGNGNATFGTTNSIVGTATNNNAAAGNIGEYVSSTIASGSAVSLATTTTSNVTSISLTAGDWDVTGVVDYAMTTATATNFNHGISTTTAMLGGQDTYAQKPFAFAGSSATLGDNTPTTRISIAGTTTVYLVAQATFSGGSIDAYGTIRARRVR